MDGTLISLRAGLLHVMLYGMILSHFFSYIATDYYRKDVVRI